MRILIHRATSPIRTYLTPLLLSGAWRTNSPQRYNTQMSLSALQTMIAEMSHYEEAQIVLDHNHEVRDNTLIDIILEVDIMPP